jgi:outer membrane biosynthesis protein TonB
METTTNKISPFIVTSAMLHGSLFVLVAFGPALFPKQNVTPWGSSSDKGTAAIEAVSNIPGINLPSQPVVNETAKPNDSKTLHPAEPTPKEPPKAPPKPAEVKIPVRGAKPEPKAATPASRATKAETPEPAPVPTNAIPGNGGQVPIPIGRPGAGQATFGGDGTFGTRFPEYVTAMTTAIEQAWIRPHASLVVGTSKRAYVTFKIVRSGRDSVVVQEVNVDEKSGSSQLDNSAQRAVLTAKLPPLPRGYSGSSVDVRFYFDYTR